jgi:uncharacterized protein YbcI
MKGVIYLKNIIKQAKKEYMNYLKNVENEWGWSYYRNYLWYLVYKKLSNEIEEVWKTGNPAYVKYGKKVIRLPINLKSEYKERYLIFHFAWLVDQIEYRIRDKIYPKIKHKIES